MESRREFLKKASSLATGAGIMSMLPPSIQRALAINPAEGSTFFDAEHVVILMQENRSFDHAYGSLQGVRGFNDPRAISLPNRNKVWLQTDDKQRTFAPFRLNMKDSNATWMSSLPHSWNDQVDARNGGKYDKWLQHKASGNRFYKEMPLTLGYYTREDIPFYYALADAFTICDHNFCSSLTGTTPNRLYLWTGTIREQPTFEAKANVKNEDVDYGKWANWKTFPERLEENGISWKIYQNEISLPVGFEDEEEGWLANFTDNPIEWFAQYKVKYSPEYRSYLQKMQVILPQQIAQLEETIASFTGVELEKRTKELVAKKKFYEILQEDLLTYTPENFEKLNSFTKNIHQKAFTNNRNDPDYHLLTTHEYDDNGTKRTVKIPKGDVLHQFRKDTETNQLPTVSWLVAPENYSDHPGAAWYGAWYVSEVLDILTKNPEIWKKTIFILTYDENDGYFDHLPPFVAPNPLDPNSGKVSAGIDTAVEQVNMRHEKQRPYKNPDKEARDGAIGLGYRVPMVVASPWSRGGKVCSEVFDHTSVLQFLEVFLQQKTKKNIKETNISEWRRTVCGNLTSVFSTYKGEKISLPDFIEKEPFIESIHQAKFKKNPSNFKALTSEEIQEINTNSWVSSYFPTQEKGIRKACILPYELYADGKLSSDQRSFELSMRMEGNAKGCPFVVYSRNETFATRNYAVKKGDSIKDVFSVENNAYELELYAPNGFYRKFKGDVSEIADFETFIEYDIDDELTGNVVVSLINKGKNWLEVWLTDEAYQTPKKLIKVAPNSIFKAFMDLQRSFWWYDFSVKIVGNNTFERRYAGHVETGYDSFTDPAMGRVV